MCMVSSAYSGWHSRLEGSIVGTAGSLFGRDSGSSSEITISGPFGDSAFFAAGFCVASGTETDAGAAAAFFSDLLLLPPSFSFPFSVPSSSAAGGGGTGE